MFPLLNFLSTSLLLGLSFNTPTEGALTAFQSAGGTPVNDCQYSCDFRPFISSTVSTPQSENRTGSRFPYVATIAFQDDSSGGVSICGGTMIEPQWLLTAASCLGRTRNTLFISVGDSDINPQTLIGQEGADLVRAHFVYDLYYGNPAEGNDIGLLYLDTHPNVAAFPHLPTNELSEEVAPNLVGIGRGLTGLSQEFSDVLQVSDGLEYNEMGTCQNETDSAPTAMDDTFLICITGPADDSAKGICQGDIGNALVLVNSNNTDQQGSNSEVPGNPADDVIYGIASFGLKECGDIDQFSLYTALRQPYLDWINRTMTNFSLWNIKGPITEQTDDATVWWILGVVLGSCLVLGVILTIVVRRRTNICSSGSRPDPDEAVVSQETNSRPGESLIKQHSIIQISPFLASLGPSSQTESTSEGPTFIESLNMDILVQLTGKRIGKGAFGQVEEGIYINNEGIPVPVAVKSMNLETTDAKSSLFNEMRIFERVGHHPNIVYCYGGNLHLSSEDPMGYYLVQELLVCDLGRFLADQNQRRKFTFQHYLQIFYGIANGLEHLHKCDVIHFDLKPSNILLDANSVPKLADFGCSRKRAHTYITAGARGTMAYMAPELWLLGLCVRKAQVRAEKLDVFSFGVVMWETFTNQTPLDPLNIQELLITQNSQDPESSLFQDRSELEIDQDFRNRRFPLSDRTCPNELKELMWSCLSYFNEIRPTLVEIKSRIEQMLEANWTDLKIKEYCTA